MKNNNYKAMSTKYIVTQIASGTLIPIMMAFLEKSIATMVPWLITMFTVVVADLAAGIWKSYKLDIPIRFSRAFRETFGKCVVYFAFVLMACCINTAANSEFGWAKWLTMFIILFEIGSMISNLLKPHGINLSMNAFIKAILTHSALPFSCPNADELIEKEDVDKIRQEELDKINKEEAWKEKKSSKGSKSTSKSKN